MVSAGGGCMADVTARKRCWAVKLRECGELLYVRRFPFGLKGGVYKSCVELVIICGGEA